MVNSDNLNLKVSVEKYTGIAFGVVGFLAIYYRFRFKRLKNKLNKMGD